MTDLALGARTPAKYLRGALYGLAAVTIWWGAWDLHKQQSDAHDADAEAQPGTGQHAPGGVLEAADQYARV